MVDVSTTCAVVFLIVFPDFVSEDDYHTGLKLKSMSATVLFRNTLILHLGMT